MSATAKSIVDSLRDIVQDLLVPELKSVKVSVDSLCTEMKLRDELLEQLVVSNSKRLDQMVGANTDRLEQMVNLSSLRLEEIVRAGDEKNEQAMKGLSEKLDFAIDIRERLVSLEARLPRQ